MDVSKLTPVEKRQAVSFQPRGKRNARYFLCELCARQTAALGMHMKERCVQIARVVRGDNLRTATETKRRSRGVLVVKRQGGGGGEQSEHGFLGVRERRLICAR